MACMTSSELPNDGYVLARQSLSLHEHHKHDAAKFKLITFQPVVISKIFHLEFDANVWMILKVRKRYRRKEFDATDLIRRHVRSSVSNTD